MQALRMRNGQRAGAEMFREQAAQVPARDTEALGELLDVTVLEREPMERLAGDGQLFAFRHEGFWQPMDTLREKRLLESLWQSGTAPWKVWE